MRGAWGATKGAWFFPKRALIELWGSHPGSIPDMLSEAHVAARREAIVQHLCVSVEVVLGSWDPAVRHDPLWTWPAGLRLSRFFSRVQ